MALLAPVADVCSMNPNVVSDHSTTIRSRLNREQFCAVVCDEHVVDDPCSQTFLADEDGGSTVSTMPA